LYGGGYTDEVVRLAPPVNAFLPHPEEPAEALAKAGVSKESSVKNSRLGLNDPEIPSIL
jgi:hypothetical protein